MAKPAVRILQRALERVAGVSPVIVPEYSLRVRSRWGWEAPVLAPLANWLAEREHDYSGAVDDVCELAEWAAGIPASPTDDRTPCWENDYWGTLDALMQCAALRRRNPETYLEIGSGWSTRFARRAIDDFGLRTRIVSVDPFPRAAVDALCDEVVREPFEAIDLARFDALGPRDIVFMDGSHMALMNSDATVFFLEVMPRLPAGVLVGIDDIFLPSDYHATWAARAYGEQYLLAAFLLGGATGWAVRFPGWWLTSDSAFCERFSALWPVVENRFGRTASSFWLERG